MDTSATIVGSAVVICGGKAEIRKRQVGERMTDWMNLAALICAGVASTGFGLLAAYWVLRAGFWLMRPQPRRAAVKPELSVARTR